MDEQPTAQRPGWRMTWWKIALLVAFAVPVLGTLFAALSFMNGLG